jgi:hypothetical protein
MVAPSCMLPNRVRAEVSRRSGFAPTRSLRIWNALATHGRRCRGRSEPSRAAARSSDLTDPDGYRSRNHVAGQTNAAKRTCRSLTCRFNTAASQAPRFRALPSGSNPALAHIRRIGHAVLNVTGLSASSEAWYKERFGFLTSDEVEAAPRTCRWARSCAAIAGISPPITTHCSSPNCRKRLGICSMPRSKSRILMI